MPFIALGKTTADSQWQRVDITKYPNPKGSLQGHYLVCQDCQKQMYIRHTIRVTAHFAHNPDPTRRCLYDNVNESEDHKAAKRFVAQELTRSPLYRDATIDYEVILRDISRIADVMVSFPGGMREVHEIQLSPISTETLGQRTNDYAKLGLDVTWWLGKDADTETNRAWTRSNYGYIATVSFRMQQSRAI